MPPDDSCYDVEDDGYVALTIIISMNRKSTIELYLNVPVSKWNKSTKIFLIV